MSSRFRVAYTDEAARLVAYDRPRDVADVIEDLGGMITHARAEKMAPILVTDPRGVLGAAEPEDIDGTRLARALYQAIGTRVSAIVHPWSGTKAPVRIRWRTSVGQARGVWLTGRRLIDWPHPGTKVAGLEALIRWLPEGMILDPCAGNGDVAVAAVRAGRRVCSVIDTAANSGPGYVAARLGQGMLDIDSTLIT